MGSNVSEFLSDECCSERFCKRIIKVKDLLMTHYQNTKKGIKLKQAISNWQSR